MSGPPIAGRSNLHSTGDLGLLAGRDVLADRLGFALHCLGGQLDAGQFVKQRAAPIEGRLTADQGQHAAHAR